MINIFETLAWNAAVRLILSGIGITASLGAQNWTAGSNGAISYNGGNVGIGTQNPSALLNLSLNGSFTSYPLRIDNASGQQSILDFAFSGVEQARVRADYLGDLVLASKGTLYLGYPAEYGINGWISFGGGQMLVSPNGYVGIGTTNPQHLLHVAGTIGAEEVLVTSTGADYVFQPGYHLRPLGEVAQYIQANHHLPDIPSSDDVKQKGMGVGEMEAKLLAKIEELTLHMIQQEKENQELRDRIARLEKGTAGETPAAAR